MSMSCSTSSIAVPRSSCTARSVSVERARLVAVETRRRLVEQQQPGLGHQRAADLDQPPAPEAQRLDRPVGVTRQAEQLERRVDARVLVGARLRRSRARPSTARRCGDASARRRAGAHAPSCPTNSSMRWNVRPMPRRARLCVGSPPIDAPAEPHGAAVGPQRAEQAVEQRRLAGAVRPDQPDDLALADRQAHVVERGDAREPHRHVARRRGAVRPRSSHAPRSRRSAPASTSVDRAASLAGSAEAGRVARARRTGRASAG